MPIPLKIAGTKYYFAVMPEQGAELTLQSDPENEHDANAIKVLAPTGEQLGHVPAAAAAVMTLFSSRIGHPIGEIFSAKMSYGEEFLLDMADEL